MFMSIKIGLPRNFWFELDNDVTFQRGSMLILFAYCQSAKRTPVTLCLAAYKHWNQPAVHHVHAFDYGLRQVYMCPRNITAE